MTDTLLDVSEDLAAELERDDGDDRAAREGLAAGFPIYYAERDTPPNLLIKEFPDGRRVLVRGSGKREQVVRPL